MLVESVNETIAIGKAADIPVVISHHKASGTPNHGLVRDTLKLIDEARKTPEARPRRLPLRRRLDHAGPAPHSAREQDHRHLVEEPSGVRRPDARRHRGQARTAT